MAVVSIISSIYNDYTYITVDSFDIETNPKQKTIDLFLLASGINSTTSGNLNLFLNGYLPNITSSIDLFLYNTGVEGSVPLYVSGYGKNAGYGFVSGDLNLYLQTGYESSGNIDFFIKSHQSVSSYSNMYLYGILGTSSGVVDFMANSYDNSSGIINLYVRGYT